MAGFVRDILATLSYEPNNSSRISANSAALSQLDERLAGFQGAARTSITIRPGDCSVWDGNPRDQPGLTYEGCRSLIESIAQEDGNRIPVLVRQNPPGSDRPYELLVGSRRRFAIDWLNHNGRPEIRLNAMVVDLSDEEAFRLADIENRERQDITELDRARSYQNAVDRFYAGVQSRMAEALNLSNSQLSRLLALAQMPDEVVSAFSTKDELRVRHSEVLTPLLRRPDQRARVVEAAKQISSEQERLAASGERLIGTATVLMRLKDAGTAAGSKTAREFAVTIGGEKIGRVKPGKDGLAVDLTISGDADLDTLLAQLRTAITEGRSQFAQASDNEPD